MTSIDAQIEAELAFFDRSLKTTSHQVLYADIVHLWGDAGHYLHRKDISTLSAPERESARLALNNMIVNARELIRRLSE